MPTSDARSAGVPAAGVSVGVAAARLGVTASTLRSWGTRYGVRPSLRTIGGHRRYSAEDLVLLDAIGKAIRAGIPPATAAAALAPAGPQDTSRPQRRGAGPGGRVLGVPGGGAAARGLARAAGQLDLENAEDIIIGSLRSRGVIPTWDDLMRPVLVAAGRYWAETGEGIEIEHVLSEAATGALRQWRNALPEPRPGRPILVTSAPRDQHSLTLYAIAAGLAERGCATRVIGVQVPVYTLSKVVRRTRPAAVFVSCVLSGAADPEALVAGFPRTRPVTPIVVGGVGWPTDLPPELVVAADLATALDLLERYAKVSRGDS
jgi:MerR family transcriptional regulator, light-induced transcriptional regulator